MARVRAAADVTSMNRRMGLTLTTSLTVATLLLGGGGQNVFAEDHENGAHDGEWRVTQPVSASPTPVKHVDMTDRRANAERKAAAALARIERRAEDATDRIEGRLDEARDRIETKLDEARDRIERKLDDAVDGIERRGDDGNDDLAAPGAGVPGEDRPGLGCGDVNHTHTGTASDRRQTCRLRDDGEDDGESMTAHDRGALARDASAADHAVVDQDDHDRD